MQGLGAVFEFEINAAWGIILISVIETCRKCENVQDAGTCNAVCASWEHLYEQIRCCLCRKKIQMLKSDLLAWPGDRCQLWLMQWPGWRSSLWWMGGSCCMPSLSRWNLLSITGDISVQF
jgi:hypothetical protein